MKNEHYDMRDVDKRVCVCGNCVRAVHSSRNDNRPGELSVRINKKILKRITTNSRHTNWVCATCQYLIFL